MREMIRDRQGSEVQDKHDLFSSLIHANKEELEGLNLTEDELMGASSLLLLICTVTQRIMQETFSYSWWPGTRYFGHMSYGHGKLTDCQRRLRILSLSLSLSWLCTQRFRKSC